MDRAKKLAGQAKGLAEQAKDVAQQAKDLAQQALGDNRGQTAAQGGSPGGGQAARPSTSTDPQYGTPYVPGMLGRPGWREQGLRDPAAILPIRERDRAGVTHTTKSEIVEEPFGMGRRWSAGPCSAGLFYQLYPEHRAWAPPGGRAPFTPLRGASTASLPDGRSLVFVDGRGRSVVPELAGLDDAARGALAQAVVAHL